jgi:hypothetical protein
MRGLRCLTTSILFTTATCFLSPSSTISARHASFGGQTMTKLKSSGPYPELCVFDLDACFWDQEMYTLSKIPDESNVVKGDLGRGEMVVGVMSGRSRISLHKGSLMALQAHHDRKYGEMKVVFASSADTPLAETIGRGESFKRFPL